MKENYKNIPLTGPGYSTIIDQTTIRSINFIQAIRPVQTERHSTHKRDGESRRKTAVLEVTPCFTKCG